MPTGICRMSEILAIVAKGSWGAFCRRVSGEISEQQNYKISIVLSTKYWEKIDPEILNNHQ